MARHSAASLSPLLGLAWVMSLLLWASSGARAETRLTLEEAVRLALSKNQELRLEQAKIAEAEARQKSTRGHFGPKVLVEGNLLVWDSEMPFKLDLPAGTSLDISRLDPAKANLAAQDLTTLLKYGDLLQVLPKVLPVFFEELSLGNIRDQVTGQLQVAVAQPLTQLLQVRAGHKATSRLVDAARHDHESKRNEIAFKVSETYLKLLQLLGLAAIAETGVQQVEAHLTQAQRFFGAGLIGKQDVLKAQLELARARERVIKARYGISLATSGLALLLGLPVEEKLVPSETVVDPPPPLTMPLEECLRRAWSNRSELRTVSKKREAASQERDRIRWDMLPQVTAVATYQHTRGQGQFFPQNAFFAGGLLKWEIWDWGTKHYEAKTAAARVAQAETGARLLRDLVALETKKAFLGVQESFEALTVARAAIGEAEENFRIEQRRFEANANTTTDVLDAQLALTRARLTYTTALYGYYIAAAELRRAMGVVAAK